ncbi:YkgJ family cysteine cluster protein [Patescibacteria group bacterium]|nr:MAG: YkgJ family cysteine cluster protein [Patescibacteria group bacterium]
MQKNKFARLCDDICANCKIDCCVKWSPTISEFDKARIRKIEKDENLFDGNLFNTPDNRCPFYNKAKKGCGIHEHRPLDCRIYPYSFWFELGRLDLWLDTKCPIAKKIVADEKFYKSAMETAKSELVHWSEGEIYAYLMASFNIDKFKKEVKGDKKNVFYRKEK